MDTPVTETRPQWPWNTDKLCNIAGALAWQAARQPEAIAVRFPRMLRIRDDKPLHEADTLATLRALIGPQR